MTVADLRAVGKQELADWMQEDVVEPFIADCAGLTADEMNVLFRDIWFHEFHGLYGFR